MVAHCVGVKSWTLPNVNIIDCYGLNDYVIARIPISETRERKMAHDRIAPRKYVLSFRPNVALEDGLAVVYKRGKPLTAEEISTTEKEWFGRADAIDTGR